MHPDLFKFRKYVQHPAGIKMIIPFVDERVAAASGSRADKEEVVSADEWEEGKTLLVV